MYIYMCKLIVSTPKRRWFCKTKAAVLLSEPHCFQRIGRRPKDRDFCWSCPFKSTKNQAPAATSSTAQTQWWRLSEGLPQKQIYTIHHPSSRKVKIWKYFLKKTAVSIQISKKKNSWFLGWRFIPNINTVPTLQGPQLPRVTTCEAMVVTRIPGSKRLVGCSPDP